MTLLQHAPRTSARLAAATIAASTLVAGLAVTIPARASTHAAPAVTYQFLTLNNSNDVTFNQLLGINNHGRIAGYYGSGAQGHRNKGYTLLQPYSQSDYRVENFPGSAQTQVTGLNDKGVTVGFFSHTNKVNPAGNANFGFVAFGDSRFRKVDFPTANGSSPPVDQLLGVNNSGVAVGFYIDSAGNAHSYLYNIHTGRFRTVSVSGGVSVTATAINNAGSVAGFFTNRNGVTRSFFLRHNGTLIVFARPGADLTQAFGVNDLGEVVGAYTIGTQTFGFTWVQGNGFRTVNDPHGVGSTIVNGVNNAGELVGFYTGGGGNTNGMLAIP
jgi:probable HAF family extracellular repeat protein